MSVKHQKAIVAWLFVVGLMVFAMIVLGGVTRLTHSGLSMVDWRPVTGWLPPLDAAEWERVFARYQEYPEYKKLNLGMTLGEFKSIFLFEYTHRLLGRLIGAAFFVPMAVFWLKGWVDRRLGLKLVGLFVVGALQGVLGWYMVKSGLVSRPDVSQYRLAAHLSLALVILGAMVWVGLGILSPERPAVPPERVPGQGPEWGPGRLRCWSWGLTALIFVTALSGAFVAGLDAGFVYNTFPLMDGAWVPDGLFELAPGYRNFFENITTVQFDHRILATTVFAAVMVFWWRARRAGLAPGQRLALNVLAAVAVAQVALGISTLLLVVPVPLAALHQAGAVALFLAAVWLAHELRPGGD